MSINSLSVMSSLRAYWKVAVLQVVGLHCLLVLSYCTGQGGHWGDNAPFKCTIGLKLSPAVTLAAAVMIWELLDLGLALPSFSRMYPTK